MVVVRSPGGGMRIKGNYNSAIRVCQIPEKQYRKNKRRIFCPALILTIVAVQVNLEGLLAARHIMQPGG